MIKIYSTLLILFLLNGCSFKSPQNEWQYKSAQAFNSYQKNFLSDNDILAQSDFTRAVNHAKQSADLTQLSRIYLSECSLNISNGIKDRCENYKMIKELSNNKELEAYYALITNSMTLDDIKELPKTYQEFALNLLNKEYEKANQNILTMERSTSTLLAGVLLEENIQTKTIEYLLQTSSHNGYKRSVLFWLNESLKYNQNQNEITQIEKKISILKTKP